MRAFLKQYMHVDPSYSNLIQMKGDAPFPIIKFAIQWKVVEEIRKPTRMPRGILIQGEVVSVFINDKIRIEQ